MGEHGLDVLAGDEAVDAEIHAGAGGDRRLADCAQFNGISVAAAGADLVTAEDVRARVEQAHARLFLLRPELAPQTLMLVRGAPVVRRR